MKTITNGIFEVDLGGVRSKKDASIELHLAKTVAKML